MRFSGALPVVLIAVLGACGPFVSDGLDDVVSGDGPRLSEAEASDAIQLLDRAIRTIQQEGSGWVYGRHAGPSDLFSYPAACVYDLEGTPRFCVPAEGGGAPQSPVLIVASEGMDSCPEPSCTVLVQIDTSSPFRVNADVEFVASASPPDFLAVEMKGWSNWRDDLLGAQGVIVQIEGGDGRSPAYGFNVAGLDDARIEPGAGRLDGDERTVADPEIALAMMDDVLGRVQGRWVYRGRWSPGSDTLVRQACVRLNGVESVDDVLSLCIGGSSDLKDDQPDMDVWIEATGGLEIARCADECPVRLQMDRRAVLEFSGAADEAANRLVIAGNDLAEEIVGASRVTVEFEGRVATFATRDFSLESLLSTRPSAPASSGLR